MSRSDLPLPNPIPKSLQLGIVLSGAILFLIAFFTLSSQYLNVITVAFLIFFSLSFIVIIISKSDSLPFQFITWSLCLFSISFDMSFAFFIKYFTNNGVLKSWLL